MKRIVTGLVALFLALSLCTLPAFASNRVPELSVDVALRADGSAYITQEFSAVTDEGTEFYLDYLDSGYLSITDFQVSDETGTYTVLPDGEWDVNASFEEKAGTCGTLPIDGGTELCWGITEYGEHRYTVEYVLHDLVSAYSDMDGFNYRFINADLGFFPTDAVVTIHNQDGTPLTDETCDIWSFGFSGASRFEDDAIRVWTESTLDGSANVTIMVGLQKGMLTPTRTVDDSFETVKERAFDGSDYEEDNTGTIGIFVILGILIGIPAIRWAVRRIIRIVKRVKRKRYESQVYYFRDLPNGGDLNVTYVLGHNLEFCPDGAFLGARILRLITLGSLEPVESMGKNVSLRLVKEPRKGDEFDETIYTFLQAAAREDGVLQSKELEKYCKNLWHESNLNDILEKCEKDGTHTLKRKKCLTGGFCEGIGDLTPVGHQQLNEVLGLKRYLLDFSLLAERYVGETFVWQDYMVYAMMFGISKQVTKQLKALYPQQLSEIEKYERYVSYSNRYDYVLAGAASRDQARRNEVRYEGGGGSSSWGGGDGFSGGGGGGTR